VEVGTRSFFAAALKVPASAAATNITTSLASYLTSQNRPFLELDAVLVGN
jgi:hypothetical protein